MPQVNEFNWFFMIFFLFIMIVIFLVSLNFFYFSNIKKINLHNFFFKLMV